jgi:hypothetical protein
LRRDLACRLVCQLIGVGRTSGDAERCRGDATIRTGQIPAGQRQGPSHDPRWQAIDVLIRNTT